MDEFKLCLSVEKVIIGIFCLTVIVVISLHVEVQSMVEVVKSLGPLLLCSNEQRPVVHAPILL